MDEVRKPNISESLISADSWVYQKTLIYLMLQHPHHHHHWRQNSLFSAIVFLRRFCQTCLFRRELNHPVFTSLEFRNVIFLTDQGPGLCIYVPQWEGGPVTSPGTGFVAFYDSQNYGGGVTRLHSDDQSQSHIATDSQSVSLSWCRSPSGANDQKLVYLF
jgi:hypothetical protein